MDKQLPPFIAVIIVALVCIPLVLFATRPQPANAITLLPDCEFLFKYDNWTVIRCREG